MVGSSRPRHDAASFVWCRANHVGTSGVQLFQGSGKLALIAAATLALALGGCGRKSSLDLPPQAAAQPAPAQGQPGQPQQNNPFGLFDPEQEEAPVAAPGQKRRIILDRILD